ncbi:hypothetical protein KI387_018844, partial [Taxus chinensis]
VEILVWQTMTEIPRGGDLEQHCQVEILRWKTMLFTPRGGEIRLNYQAWRFDHGNPSRDFCMGHVNKTPRSLEWSESLGESHG